MAEAAHAPAQASEPPEADPRAPMKAHLYQMAQSAFELQLNRDFPKYKTMLEGWDGQQFFWQKANKPAMAEHLNRSDGGGSSSGVGRSEETISQEQGSRDQPRPDEQAQQEPSACSLGGQDGE